MKYKYNGEWVDLSIKALDSMEIGTIVAFAGTTIPTGWLECNGASITESAYPELYALIGGTLPDFRGRVLVGQDTNDTDFDTLLETGGSKTNKLIPENYAYETWMTQTYDADIRKTTTFTGDNYGMNARYSSNINTPVNNLQPYAVVKHIIKATNTTPTMASVVNTTNSSTIDAYSCDYVNNLVDYSTTEIKTGAKWIDGKSIYRKVFDTTLPSATGSAWQSVGTISTNTDTIIKVYGNRTTGTNEISDAFVGSEWYSNKTYLYIRTSSSYEINRQKYIVVEYTKTTD